MLASYCRDSYLSRGFVVSEPIFDDQWLARIGEAVDALHRRALAGEPELASISVFEKDLPAKKRGGVEIEPTQNAVFILPDPSRFDPLFLSVFAQDALIAMVKDLLQASEVEIHFANITTKSPSIGSGVSWHRDFPNEYICPETPQMLRTMICVDGMDDANGVTQFVAGTHLDAEAQGKTISADDGRIVAASCGAGAVVAIHPLVLHGGLPNFSRKPRRNIVIQWGKRGVPLVTSARESITGLGDAELVARAGEASRGEGVLHLGRQSVVGVAGIVRLDDAKKERFLRQAAQ